ncbi:uncharacterized protein LOC133734894 [Rosa rugosa]|uniref:uncharacterized protein LOC133734894 n=1 Tax=Rosa rugosa TaxID=74645 RepID=UPI002B40EB77|nr:uncharacterized protein LOC133734894 [Rosa rugosa]
MNELVNRLPYILVRFRVNNVSGGFSTDVVRNGFMVDGSGERRPVLGHIFPLNDPDSIEWMRYSILYRHQNLLSVLACTNENDFPHMGIVLSEHSDTTFAMFLQNDPVVVTTEEPSVSFFTYAARKHLKSILTGIVYLKYSGCAGNGKIEINNIYIVGGVAKLGSVSVGGRATSDVRQFCDMLWRISHRTVPSEFVYFVRSVTVAGPGQNWMDFNIANSPNHPHWMNSEELIIYHQEVWRKLKAIKKNDNRLHKDLNNAFKRRLNHYSILNTGWMNNVMSIGDHYSSSLLLYAPYDSQDVFEFARFCRNYHAHAEDSTGQGGSGFGGRQGSSQAYGAIQGYGGPIQGSSQGYGAGQGYGTIPSYGAGQSSSQGARGEVANHAIERAQLLTSYFPGYFAVLHEVLSGFRVFITLPPHGAFFSVANY